jgi:hypothetical protein
VRGTIEVESVRASVRQGPDGFFLKETIVAYVQTAEIFGSEVGAILNCALPTGMTTRDRITAFGGGVVVFDQYGRIKYHIAHRLDDGERQSRRLQYLMETGGTAARPRGARNRFAGLHRARAQS